VEIALHQLVLPHGHVVAQIVEAELAADAVGDVGFVGLAAGARPPVDQPLVFQFRAGVDVLRVEQGREPQRADDADRHTEQVEDLAHPAAVAAGQILVDRHQVRALPGQRVEVERQCGDKRLALAGAHLDDVALMEQRAAHKLHVVGTQPDGATRCLAHERVGFRQHIVKVCPRGHAVFQFGRAVAKDLVGQLLQSRFVFAHGGNGRPQIIDYLLVRITDYAGYNFLKHGAHNYRESPREEPIP